MSSTFWWYVARSAGMVAWALLTASVLWGLALSTRSVPNRRPAWLLDLHRWLGGLTLAFVGLHMVALVADSTVQLGPAAILVPGFSPYRPLAVSWGVIAAWALVAVQATSQARQRLSRRAWKAIHLSSYGAFALSTLHAFTAGTDAGTTLVRATGVLGVAGVVLATAWRIVDEVIRSSSPARTAPRGHLIHGPTAPVPRRNP